MKNKNEIQNYLFSKHLYKNNPFVLKKYSDLEKFLETESGNFIKFCYIYREKIHLILYDEEKLISIKFNKYNKLSHYAYLILLIKENADIVNYSYELDLINLINNENIKINKENIVLKNLIIAKIILELLENYKGLVDYDNDDNTIIEECDRIESFNLNIIKNHLKYFQEMGIIQDINKYKDLKIDILYFDIINSLIVNKKLEDYDYSYNIINQLDLEDFDITYDMYDKLLKFFNEYNNESYINNYIISKIEDLFNKNIINFYYILIKYILKHPIYIYNFPLLLKTRNIIIIAIKTNIDELLSISFNDDNINERKNYIIKTIIDSEYYYNKYWQLIQDKLNILLNYYMNYKFESKIDEIKSIKDIINNKNGNYEQYIKELKILDFEKVKEINDEYDIIKYINNEKYKNNPKTEENFENSLKFWENSKKIIKDIKNKILNKDDAKLLLNYFNDQNNKNRLLKIFTQDEYDFFISKFNIDMIKEILTYYNNLFFESKKEDIILIEAALKNKRGLNEIYEKYKNDYEEAQKFNERLEIIDFIFNVKNKDNKIQKTEPEMIEIYNDWKKIEKIIIDKKIKKMNKTKKSKLFEYIQSTDKNLILKIFTSDIYEFLLDESKHFKQTEKNDINTNLKEILQYYQQYFPESKKKDISLIKQILNNTDINNEEYKQYLEDLDAAKKMNLKTPFIKKLLLDKEDKEEPKTEEEIQSAIKDWSFLEVMLNNEKGRIKSTLRRNKKQFLFDIFKNDNYKEQLIKIFGEEIYNNFFIINEKPNKDNKNKEIKEIKEIKENKENGISLNNANIIKKSTNIDNNNQLIPINDENSVKKQNMPNNTLVTINQSTKFDTNSKKKDIYSEIKNLLPYNKKSFELYKNLADGILKKSVIKFHTNKNKQKPFIIYDEINYGKCHIKINIEKLDEIENFFTENKIEISSSKKLKQYKEFLNEISNKLENEFMYEYYLEIKLEIQLSEPNNYENLTCKYIFYSPDPNEKNPIIFKDDNILVNKTNSLSQGFHYLISEINDEKYKDKEYIEKIRYDTSEMSQKSIKSIKSKKIIKSIVSPANNKSIILNSLGRTVMPQKKYNSKNNNNLDKKIIIFEDIIGSFKGSKNNYSAEFIKELKNQYFISGGTDNTLKVFTKDLKPNENIPEIRDIKEWTYNICERSKFSDKESTRTQFITCSNREIYLYDIDLYSGNFNTQKYELPNMTCVNCIEMKTNHFAMIGLNGGLYFIDLFNSERQVRNIAITDKTFRGGIRISDNIIALTSNKVALGGEDLLIFFNSEKKNKNNNNSYKKISREIEGYSFTLNTNGLALMEIEKEEVKYKILICTCKKYLPDQKNGILLVNPQLDEYKKVVDDFYDTGEFEVYCICPLLQHSGGEWNIKTNYFLIGGFNNEKYIGQIKLYKVIPANKPFNTKIEFLQDIEFEKNDNFGGFEGPISCIIQSSYYGNIIATCYDGNIYKLSSPDLSFYMKNKK